MKCIQVKGQWGRHHNWNKWEAYKRPMMRVNDKHEFVEHWQKRTCETCGFEEREKLHD